jgi:hypothetical protein
MSNARHQVNLPSILLVLTGVMGLIVGLFGIIQAAIGSNEVDPALLAGMPPEQAELLLQIVQGAQSGGLVINFLVLATSAFVIFGALKMRKLELHALGVAASVVAMLPCVGPCCCIGLPVGLWSLIVLMKDEVKTAFSS